MTVYLKTNSAPILKSYVFALTTTYAISGRHALLSSSKYRSCIVTFGITLIERTSMHSVLQHFKSIQILPRSPKLCAILFDLSSRRSRTISHSIGAKSISSTPYPYVISFACCHIVIELFAHTSTIKVIYFLPSLFVS